MSLWPKTYLYNNERLPLSISYLPRKSDVYKYIFLKMWKKVFYFISMSNSYQVVERRLLGGWLHNCVFLFLVLYLSWSDNSWTGQNRYRWERCWTTGHNLKYRISINLLSLCDGSNMINEGIQGQSGYIYKETFILHGTQSIYVDVWYWENKILGTLVEFKKAWKTWYFIFIYVFIWKRSLLNAKRHCSNVEYFQGNFSNYVTQLLFCHFDQFTCETHLLCTTVIFNHVAAWLMLTKVCECEI